MALVNYAGQWDSNRWKEILFSLANNKGLLLSLLNRNYEEIITEKIYIDSQPHEDFFFSLYTSLSLLYSNTFQFNFLIQII